MDTLTQENTLVSRWHRVRAAINNRATGFLFSLLATALLVVLMPNLAHAAAGVEEIGTSLTNAETPISDLCKKVGSTLLFVVLAVCGIYNFLGQEWTRKAKGMAISGVIGTGVIYNLFALRDFVTGLFGG